MAAITTPNITKQPRNYDIHNTFGLMGNERFLNSWSYTEGTCDCSGSYYTTLTDTRLLIRTEDSQCCSCCGEQDHTDRAIFLRDISEMVESTEARDCCSNFCFKCCRCCACCCQIPKYIEIRGSFGSEVIHLTKIDMPIVQLEVPAAIGNHKLVSQY